MVGGRPFFLPDALAATFEIKAVRSKERIIEGYASVYGNVDLGADVVKSGAFSDWLTKHQPADCLVFIGHDYKRLPVGVPITIREDGLGLFCSTKIFDGPSGDDLLAAAEGLASAGKSLGMSIGYTIEPGGYQYTKVDGQSVRELSKLGLREFSYTPIPMNPAAGVTSVKDDDKAALGSFGWTIQHVQQALYEKHQRGCYIVDIFPGRVIYRTYSSEDVEQLYECSYSISGTDVTLGDPTPVDVQYTPMPGKADPTPAPEAPGRTTDVKDLPDSAFLYVEAGDKDDQGRTVQTKRHFPYRDADGKIDAALLKGALAEISASTVMDASTKQRLQARVRQMTIASDPERYDRAAWKSAEPALDLIAIAHALIDTAERIVGEHDAMKQLGQDDRGGKAVRPETRQAIAEFSAQLARIVEQASIETKDQEEMAAAEWWRAQIALLEAHR